MQAPERVFCSHFEQVGGCHVLCVGAGRVIEDGLRKYMRSYEISQAKIFAGRGHLQVHDVIRRLAEHAQHLLHLDSLGLVLHNKRPMQLSKELMNACTSLPPTCVVYRRSQAASNWGSCPKMASRPSTLMATMLVGSLA